MNKIEEFKKERDERINKQSSNDPITKCASEFITHAVKSQYLYNFSWMGIPIIQFPQEIAAIQEIIWDVKPDLIIETGIAHGGSIIFSASMLELLGGDGKVVGIDIDIRSHNRVEIEKHPMFKRVILIEGSSVSDETFKKVKEVCKGRKKILVILDSNHTHEHVMNELKLFAPLVSVGSYLIVLDTIIEDLPDELFSDRTWAKGDNPKTAVHQFLKTSKDFVIDKKIESKLLITVAPDGYLKRIS